MACHHCFSLGGVFYAILYRTNPNSGNKLNLSVDCYENEKNKWFSDYILGEKSEERVFKALFRSSDFLVNPVTGYKLSIKKLILSCTRILPAKRCSFGDIQVNLDDLIADKENMDFYLSRVYNSQQNSNLINPDSSETLASSSKVSKLNSETSIHREPNRLTQQKRVANYPLRVSAKTDINRTNTSSELSYDITSASSLNLGDSWSVLDPNLNQLNSAEKVTSNGYQQCRRTTML